MRERHIQQEFYSPADLGLVEKLLSATTNSTAMLCEGFNQLALDFDVTWAAATAVTFFIQTSHDGTAWRRLMAGSLAGTGVETLTPHQWSRAVAASENFEVNIPINAKYVRIQSLTATGAPTSDTVSVRATLGVV